MIKKSLSSGYQCINLDSKQFSVKKLMVILHLLFKIILYIYNLGNFIEKFAIFNFLKFLFNLVDRCKKWEWKKCPRPFLKQDHWHYALVLYYWYWFYDSHPSLVKNTQLKLRIIKNIRAKFSTIFHKLYKVI